MDEEFIGAIKIKDALFIGDKDSSQDLDFLISSKITHIINAASLEVKDEWSSIGILYLSFPFQDTESENIFKSAGEVFHQCFEFIEKTLELGESVLIHSVKGESRCVCLALGYLMQKYHWTLSKALEFFNSRKPDCSINSNFLHQLVKFENVLSQNFTLSKNWELTANEEETLLRNTFLNSRPGEFVQLEKLAKKAKKNTLRWIDEFHSDKKSRSLKKIKKNENTVLKSCLKLAIEPRAVLVNISKSLNNLTGRPLSSTVKDYLEEGKQKKIVRTASVSKRENSPRPKDTKRVENKKKKIFAFGMIDPVTIMKKTLAKPRAGSVRRPSPYLKPCETDSKPPRAVKRISARLTETNNLTQL